MLDIVKFGIFYGLLCVICVEASPLREDIHSEDSPLVEDSDDHGSACLLSSDTSLLRKARLEVDHVPSYDSYIVSFGRELPSGTPEYNLRRKLYEQRVQEVRLHNERPERSWTAGINFLSDRTEAELAALNGWRGTARSLHQGQISMVARASVVSNASSRSRQPNLPPVPDEKHYRNLRACRLSVSQGGCGSCWAIAAAITLQAGAEAHGINRTYSAQELVSCVPNPRHCGGAGGCLGATVELAMEYLVDNGLRTEAEWPYSGKSEACLKAKESATPTRLFSWETLPSNKYQPLLQAVAHVGPVAVSVSASGWFNYQSGIYNSCPRDCVINHAVTLIGYGRESPKKYWLIKNSWGPTWGESGFLRLSRNDEDEEKYCGIDRQPQDGTGCDDGPKQVTVCGMCGILYDNVLPHFA